LNKYICLKKKKKRKQNLSNTLINDLFIIILKLIVVSRPDKLSGAEIASICQEAGMHAVRKNRYVILTKDLEKG